MPQSNSLYLQLINSVEAEDKNESFELFYARFQPLLRKHASKLGESDAKFFLSEALYFALTKIPISLDRFQEDKYIVSYIKKAIYAEYIKISKFNNIAKSMHSLDDERMTSAYAAHGQPDEDLWFRELREKIHSILSVDEEKYFELKFVLGYSETEISKLNHVTRQAVNKRIRKIIHKLEELKNDT